MKKLVNFLIVLFLGMFLGYVFHNRIDTKLRSWFGDEKVNVAVEKTKVLIDKGEKITKGAIEGAKDSIKDE